MSTSNIEWTEQTWNPVSGCTRASPGCDSCYAVTMTHRLESMGQVEKYGGLTVLNAKGDRHFNGVVRTHDGALTIPLKRRKPTTWFVNSMSDLFHRDVTFEFIDKVFAVMALTPHHTYQILTKRPERMAEYLGDLRSRADLWHSHDREFGIFNELGFSSPADGGEWKTERSWPLPNVWLGTSVENQEWADKRIPHLRRCPAVVHFLSVEPLLGPIDFDARPGRKRGKALDNVQWVIVGGESGPGARPMNIEWARSLVTQCKATGVPVFMKQLGASPYVDPCPNCGHPEESHGSGRTAGCQHGDGSEENPICGCRKMRGELSHKMGDPYAYHAPRDNKGGAMEEWPEDLRVRELPAGLAYANPEARR